jgi:membrane associated rhomboid family serine protease
VNGPAQSYNRTVSTGGPDLFVICKSCGSEVSPYITECPYCGNRLRKRAPKLDRDQRPAEKRARRHRSAPPLLSRLRPGEMPGIRADRRPYATLVLVALGLVGTVLWRTGLGGLGSDLLVVGKPGAQWWRLFTASFVYDNTGYAFVTIGAIALYGWLLERRHGPLVPIALFLLGGVGGLAATGAIDAAPVVLGANGAALAMICAWLVPDLLEFSRTGDVEGDLIGTIVIAVAVALMAIAVPFVSAIADVVGIGVGFLLGLALSRTTAR